MYLLLHPRQHVWLLNINPNEYLICSDSSRTLFLANRGSFGDAQIVGEEKKKQGIILESERSYKFQIFVWQNLADKFSRKPSRKM